MTTFTFIRVIWDRQLTWPLSLLRFPAEGGGEHIIRFHEVHVGPEPGFPAGRKGLALQGAWRQYGSSANADGMVILDGDVAIDPQMVSAMLTAMDKDPSVVWTAPVRLWPASRMERSWVWGHWTDHPSQVVEPTAKWFSFGFTYLPAELLEAAIKAGLRTWTYPSVDARMSKLAVAKDIPALVVPECWPVHLHF